MKRFAFVILVAGLICTVVPSASGAPAATVVHVTRLSTWHRPSPDPTGIAYQRGTGRLIVVDSEVDETPWYKGANVWLKPLARRTPAGHWSTLRFSQEPTDVAVRGPRTLVFTDDQRHRIFFVHPGSDHRWGTSDDVVSQIPTGAFGAQDAEGLAFAKQRKRTFLLVLSGKRSMVFRLAPGRNGRFDGVPPTGDDVVRGRFSTAALGLTDPKGIAWDRRSKLLYIVGHDQEMILRTRLRGALVDTIDLSATTIRHLSGITLAPGSRDGSVRHVYLTDWGARHKNDGRIFEIAIHAG
ncbi:MAG TPA: hypothetical protein VE646_14150 [Actinomycetota bacterium]|nr:hypothetical protein [Actinomycetota bacterium]